MERPVFPVQPAEGEEEERCRCNRLLCITRDNVIEIKCNKCKRLLRIYTSGIVRKELVDR